MKHLLLLSAILFAATTFANDNGDNELMGYDEAEAFVDATVAESAGPGGDEINAAGHDSLWNNCVRRNGPVFCREFMNGYEYSEGVLRDLLRRTGGSKFEACRQHILHYNRHVRVTRGVPFRKGYVYFGRVVAHCD